MTAEMIFANEANRPPVVVVPVTVVLASVAPPATLIFVVLMVFAVRPVDDAVTAPLAIERLVFTVSDDVVEIDDDEFDMTTLPLPS